MAVARCFWAGGTNSILGSLNIKNVGTLREHQQPKVSECLYRSVCPFLYGDTGCSLGAPHPKVSKCLFRGVWIIWLWADLAKTPF
jgi:hypothetical protein